MKDKLILLAVSAGLFWIGSKIAGTTGTLSVLLCAVIYIGIFIQQMRVVATTAINGVAQGSVREGATRGALGLAYTAPMWILIALLWLWDISHNTGYASNPIAILFAIFGPGVLINRANNKRAAAAVMRRNEDTDSSGQAVTHGRTAKDFTKAERPAPAPATPATGATSTPRTPVDYSGAERPVTTPDEVK